MTREQYDKLNVYEQQLRWAVRSNFVHMSALEFAKVAALYEELYGQALTQAQKNCNTCRLNALKKMGADYFAFQQELAQDDKDTRMEDKKKVGRKKKIDID